MPRLCRRVGVVTVTFNGARDLPGFLASIRAQTGADITLYVVDNASTDSSVGLVKACDLGTARLVLIEQAANCGVAAANNCGIERALADRVDWVLLLNNDTLFGSDMISSLVDVAEASRAQLLSPIIEGNLPPGSLWYGGGRIVKWQGYRAFHPGMAHTAASDRITEQPAEPTEYAPTCCLLVHPNVFRVVGLMDPSYFVYQDDVDFAIRCRRAGFGYYVTSNTRLLHNANSSTGGDRSAFSVAWRTRNWVLLARRYLRGPRLLLALFYIQLRIVAAQYRWRDTAENYCRAQRWFLHGLRDDKRSHAIPDVARRTL